MISIFGITIVLYIINVALYYIRTQQNITIKEL